jgi:predicted O-methyltransferase YrrM
MGAIVPDSVERYLHALNRQRDALLDEIARAGRRAGLPLVDAEVGALLRVLVRVRQAKRILEIGAAVGYSGIWLAGGLPPDGLLVTIERESGHVATARANFDRAGLGGRVQILLGEAADLVPRLDGPFDFVFQDGSKALYLPLLERLVDLLSPGGLLVTDNVLWYGQVVPGFKKKRSRPDTGKRARPDADTRAIAAYNKALARHPRLATAIIPMRDGLALSVKRSA